MAKQKRIPVPSAERAAKEGAAAPAQQPVLRWKVIAQIVAGLAVLWVLAFMTQAWISWWGVGVAGVLTATVIGFGIYVWRITAKTKAITQLLQGATDAEGRKSALEKLDTGDAKDALNALARAQLLAQEDPQKAIDALVAVDLEKAPGASQDEVRTMHAFLLLSTGRAKEARPVADKIRLDRQPAGRGKAFSAAVMAEALARTGAADEARKLVDTYSADDAEYREVAPVLLRAAVWTFVAQKKRGLARKAMDRMVAIDPNHVAPFVDKRVEADVRNMAVEALGAGGYQARPKMSMKMVK